MSYLCPKPRTIQRTGMNEQIMKWNHANVVFEGIKLEVLVVRKDIRI